MGRLRVAGRSARQLRRHEVAQVATAGALILLVGAAVGRPSWLLEGATALTFAVAATGLGLALGLGGEFLLGQLAIFAVGAYATAALIADAGWPFLGAAALGVVCATAAGALLSLVALRVSRFYFALIGFFAVYLVPDLVQIFGRYTGGPAGLTVPITTIAGIAVDTKGMYFLAAVCLIVVLLLLANLRHSPLGLQMRILRNRPEALAVTGTRAWQVRLAMYVACSACAGIGGAVYSNISGYLLPTSFDLGTCTLLFAAVLVGGSTSLCGPLIGIFVLYVIPQTFFAGSSFGDILYGGIVVAAALARSGLLNGRVQRSVGQRFHRDAGSAGSASSRSSPPAAPGPEDPAQLADAIVAIRGGRDRRQLDEITVAGAGKSFGGAIRALDFGPDDAVSVKRGQVHLLVGPNGSGKTTLLNVFCGLQLLDRGQVLVDGRPANGQSAVLRARCGVTRSFQSPMFPDEVTPADLIASKLDALAGLSYASWLVYGLAARRRHRASIAQAREILKLSGLGPSAEQPCRQLSSGQRRMLDVLVALVSVADIVLLDEPAAGLVDAERNRLRALIRELSAREIGFLVVEHDLEFGANVADWATVLANGRCLADGSPADVFANETVREVLIGAR